jgi:enamine deaminase RidA (YjgF/YER057c/UK114 family)
VAAKEYRGSQAAVDEVLAPSATGSPKAKPSAQVSLDLRRRRHSGTHLGWDVASPDGQPYIKGYTWALRLADGTIVDGTFCIDFQRPVEPRPTLKTVCCSTSPTTCLASEECGCGSQRRSCKLGPMDVERRLDELGLTLPAAAALPPGIELPFAWARVRGNRAFVSGHGALAADGSPAGPFGKVPSQVTLRQAQHSTRLATLAVLASLKAVLGDLDRVSAWLMVNGYVNAEPGYPQTTAVMNPFSELINDLYGADAGSHARTAIGVATVPLNLPVVISAEVEIAPPKP